MSSFASEVLGVVALGVAVLLWCVGWELGMRAARRWFR